MSASRLPFGVLNEKNAVFVGFFVRSQLYQGYSYVAPEDRIREYTQILLLLRWDARFGFPGGLVDPGESLIDTALREVQEEINFFQPNHQLSLSEQTAQLEHFKSRLTPLGSHEVKLGLNAHIFSCEITPHEREYIKSTSHLAPHAHAEVAGVNFIHCFDLPNKGISQFLKHGLFAPGVQEEISWILEAHQINIFTPRSSRTSS